MQTYPSINNIPTNKPCYGFIKYDGSNMRAEWNKKKSWYKFGTRKCMIDANTPLYGLSVKLFMEKYGQSLDKLFRTSKEYKNIPSFVVFFEFFGTKSFAGHHEQDDKFDVVLFDISPHKKGLIGPKEFLDNFSYFGVAELVYVGNCNQELVQRVKSGELSLIQSSLNIKTQIPEGIVCKGGNGHDLWMCKIKTNEYLAQLKSRFQNWKEFC